jgi:HK97 family phage portal protein
MASNRIWKPSDGYFGTLLRALLGQVTRRDEGRQESGSAAGIGGGQPITPETAMKISAVWACVRLIAETIGSMPIDIYDGNEKTTNHWLYKLLNRRPNSLQTRNEFIETIIINALLHGNLYAAKAYGGPRNRDVVSLLPLSADQTTVNWKKSTGKTFEYRQGNTLQVYSHENMWHVPLILPGNGLVGMSPLQYGARSMGIAAAAEDRVDSMARNGFKPAGVLMIDTALDSEQREAIRKEYSDLIEGKGDPLKVLEASMKYQAVSISPKDAQLLESRQYQVKDVCRFYGVPSILVNDDSDTTKWGTGVGEIKEGFYTFTIRPILEKLESSIERWLLSEDDRGRITVKFDFDALLRGNEGKRIENMTKAISGKLLTIDEARKRFDGLPPLPDGLGSVIYDQSQMIPLGSEGDTSNDNPQSA